MPHHFSCHDDQRPSLPLNRTALEKTGGQQTAIRRLTQGRFLEVCTVT